jgi:hypothetical protein
MIIPSFLLLRRLYRVWSNQSLQAFRCESDRASSGFSGSSMIKNCAPRPVRTPQHCRQVETSFRLPLGISRSTPFEAGIQGRLAVTDIVRSVFGVVRHASPRATPIYSIRFLPSKRGFVGPGTDEKLSDFFPNLVHGPHRSRETWSLDSMSPRV